MVHFTIMQQHMIKVYINLIDITKDFTGKAVCQQSHHQRIFQIFEGNYKESESEKGIVWELYLKELLR